MSAFKGYVPFNHDHTVSLDDVGGGDLHAVVANCQNFELYMLYDPIACEGRDCLRIGPWPSHERLGPLSQRV